ncbi:GSCFA domain-containing protein [Sphingomonas sp. RS6]
MVEKSFAVIGNCQARPLSDYLAAMVPNAQFVPGFSREINTGLVSMDELIKADCLIVQSVMEKRVRQALKEAGSERPIISCPTIYFTGFHPDCVFVRGPKGLIATPLHNSNSAIAIAAWKAGLTVEDAVKLFNESAYRLLGYFDYLDAASAELVTDARRRGLDIADEMASWTRVRPFMHTPNHPKPVVLAGLARAILEKMGERPAVRYPEGLIPDQLTTHMIWPIYPELAKAFGCDGEYIFKPPSGKRAYGAGLAVYSLEEFVAGSYEVYDNHDPATLECSRLEDGRYAALIESFKSRRSSVTVRSHPYRGLPDYQFWRKGVTAVAADAFDPVRPPSQRIGESMQIATAGSCFAQHIAKALAKSGYNYFVAEPGPSDAAQREARQFGVFSARYGNIYTAAQLNQLFDRATGTFQPDDVAWTRSDGRFVDPFRPRVEPEGYATVEDVIRDRSEHFASVNRMWRSLDVFVFTLGLTESWRAIGDGAVFPLAPGVVAGEMDPAKYEFHNYTVDETVQQMEEFLGKLRAVNPRARVILTVSPVPLEATYENRHVLLSTTYSKSVLRAAAEALSSGREWIDYFPSYEIITGNYNRGKYYAEDLREVTAEGVGHVMRLFLKHYTYSGVSADQTVSKEAAEGQAVICDEEALRV